MGRRRGCGRWMGGAKVSVVLLCFGAGGAIGPAPALAAEQPRHLTCEHWGELGLLAQTTYARGLAEGIGFGFRFAAGLSPENAEKIDRAVQRLNTLDIQGAISARCGREPRGGLSLAVLQALEDVLVPRK